MLVLTPTRELTIQVAEAFQRYAHRMKGFHVLPIYGGQEYSGQIRALRRGVHIIVGTPGRVMYHMRKRTLKLDNLQALVLDEADEMLRMGFIDDVDRISHVINYDIPYDTEAYIHRIGRTGRAGRTGEAILFVSPRERRMLASIEKATRQKIKSMTLPSAEMVNSQRIAKFKQGITDAFVAGELDFIQGILESYEQEHDVSPIEIAAALAKLSIGEQSLFLEPEKKNKRDKRRSDNRRDERSPRRERQSSKRKQKASSEGMERFRIEVGHDHEVQPGNIVSAIANDAGLDAEHIGHIDIKTSFSFIELPEGMPKAIFNDLKKVWVSG